MTNNMSEFKQFVFWDNIDHDYLESIFESAWDTLLRLYPSSKFDSCDAFAIYKYSESLDDESNDDLVYVLGICDGKPAIQNLGTKGIIPIELNSKRWYDYSEESQLKAGFLLSGIIREILVGAIHLIV